MAVSFGLYRTGTDLRGSNPSGGSGLALFDSNFTYAGAFRVPVNVTGSSLAYSAGVIGLSATAGNMYVSLHTTTNRGICELQIPALSTSTDINDLNYATEVQGRFDVFNTPDGNPDGNDLISGLYVHDGKLVVSTGIVYDANGTGSTFLSVLDTPSDFSTTAYGGMYDVNGRFEAAGWTSPVPTELQAELGYTHIMGHADNYSIVSRASLGPSAFGVNLSDVTAPSPTSPIATEAFQSYPFAQGSVAQAANPALTHSDYLNGNNIYSVSCHSGYGMIIPGTRKYIVFGRMTGISGIGYKITQDNGFTCGGYCPVSAADWSPYGWVFDIDDWVAVKNATKQPHEVAPSEHGDLNLPLQFANGASVSPHGIGVTGGAFDSVNNRLYLCAAKNDPATEYSDTPLIYAYDYVGGS